MTPLHIHSPLPHPILIDRLIDGLFVAQPRPIRENFLIPRRSLLKLHPLALGLPLTILIRPLAFGLGVQIVLIRRCGGGCEDAEVLVEAWEDDEAGADETESYFCGAVERSFGVSLLVVGIMMWLLSHGEMVRRQREGLLYLHMSTPNWA